jgi:hypothetical protein
VTRFVYPRLPLGIARARIDELTDARASGGIGAVAALAGVDHPRAAPVATGARVVSSAQIREFREAVLSQLQTWTTQADVPRNQAAAFDLTLGHVLHRHLEIVPADAAHSETWNFLTLIVLPDIAVVRFPDMHFDRMTGTPRNVLRRTWIREEVLGDLLRSSDRPLGEDELVGIFERSALARNRALVRRLAAAVLGYTGSSARSEWARELYKQVIFSTGPRLLDALTENELDDLIRGDEQPQRGVEQAQPPPPSNEPADSATAPATDGRILRSPDLVWPTTAGVRGSDGITIQTEVESTPAGKPDALFHGAMVDLYQRTKRELGYNATYFARMLANEGGVATARKLVMSDRASDGFTYLWEHGRLDLSVEALVVDKRFDTLFDDVERERAAQRLASHGYYGT